MNAHEKGAQGERLVAMALDGPFPAGRRFDNLIVPARNGLTQIDHVLNLPAGIFVIEVKKHEGQILGDIDAPRWVQRIRTRLAEFANPLHQNARHVSALRWQLGLRDQCFQSVVAFIGRAEIVKPIAPNVISTIAVGCPLLVSYIRSFEQNILSVAEMHSAVRRIGELANAGYTREQLLTSIRDRCGPKHSNFTPALREGGSFGRPGGQIALRRVSTNYPRLEIRLPGVGPEILLKAAREKYRSQLNNVS